MIAQSKPYLISRNFCKKIYHQLKKPRKTKFPEIISIELSTLCNAKCKFCPHSNIHEKDKKRAINMSEEVFRKIIDQCVDHKELKLIKPSLFGEPSITPHLFERLEYIKEKLPTVKIRLISNGLAMTPEKIDKLVENRLCDEINFSLDADEKETFEKFKGISWDKVIRNINYSILRNNESGKRIRIILSFVCTPENEGQLKGFKERWKGKVQGFHIGSESGVRRRKNLINKKTTLPCPQIFNRLNFLSDGRAVLCCIDAYGEVIVGDIKEQNLLDIWNSPKFGNIRRLHLNGEKYKIPLCNICEEWY